MRHYIPEDHLVHAGALLSVDEAHRYLRPGQYTVRGRIGSGPVSELMLLVGIGRAKLKPPPMGAKR